MNHPWYKDSDGDIWALVILDLLVFIPFCGVFVAAPFGYIAGRVWNYLATGFWWGKKL